MKKDILIILSLGILVTMIIGLVGCSPTEPIDEPQPVIDDPPSEVSEPDTDIPRVAFMFHTRGLDFYVYMAAAAQKAADDLGIIVDIYDAQGELTNMDANYDQVRALNYDLIITVGDESTVASVLEAQAAGIPFINVDMQLDQGEYVARISTDNFGMGASLGEYALEYLTEKFGEPKGQVIYTLSPGSPIQNFRVAGFLSVLEQYPNIEIEELILESFTAEPTQRQVEDLLTRKPLGTIDLIMSCNAGNSLGTLAAVETANRTEIAVVGIDNEEGQLEALENPNSPYKITVVQSPIDIGRLGVEAAYDYLVNGIEGGTVQLEGEVVTKDNVSEYIVKLKTQKTELEKYIN